MFWRSLEGSTTNLDRRDSAWLNALGCGKAQLITWCVQVLMVCDDLCRTVLSLRSRGPGKGPLLHVPCVVASYPSSSWGPWRQLFLAGSGTHQSAPWGPGSVFLARWRHTRRRRGALGGSYSLRGPGHISQPRGALAPSSLRDGVVICRPPISRLRALRTAPHLSFETQISSEV